MEVAQYITISTAGCHTRLPLWKKIFIYIFNEEGSASGHIQRMTLASNVGKTDAGKHCCLSSFDIKQDLICGYENIIYPYRSPLAAFVLIQHWRISLHTEKCTSLFQCFNLILSFIHSINQKTNQFMTTDLNKLF